MSLRKSGFVSLAFVAALAANARPAAACGGCFVPPEQSTQVTGHRMVLSVGMTQSSLVDQIEYSGDPSSFAWVLPIKGKVDVGVSSDLLFAEIENDTKVNISAPPHDCAAYHCYNDAEDPGALSSGEATASSSAGGGVNVIAQSVVGPYETVQLASSDPQALEKWLGDHGYQLPADVQPIVDAYVKDGFDFLAVKLVPGQGVQAMQPIRVTTPGANIALPLRMVAAGTGQTTTITLFVLGDFRAETANFPTFTIDPATVVWDYDQDRSNYTDLRDQAYQASQGFGWLAESAQPYSLDSLRSRVEQLAEIQPEQSGYGSDPQTAQMAADADLNALFSGIDDNGAWVTRLRANLSRPALATDLFVQAAKDQSQVSNFIQTSKSVGQPPACPPVPPDCGGPGSGPGSDPGSGLEPGQPGGDFWSGGQSPNGSGAACAAARAGSPDADAVFGVAMAAVGLTLLRRRRAR